MSKLLSLKKLKGAIAILLFVISSGGCSIDEIVIKLVPNNEMPEFEFAYLRRPEEPVRIFSIKVSVTGSNEVVWFIHSVEGEGALEQTRHLELSDRRRGEIDWSKVRGVPIQRLRFSEVPTGFDQTFPLSADKPVLEMGKRYRIEVMSGAGEGVMEFALSDVSFGKE